MTLDLLRCTYKKSVDVTTKIVLWLSYAIVAITLCAIGTGAAMVFWGVIVDSLLKIVILIVAFMFGIPWYYYAGIVVIACIPTYSFIWCVARELTDEDWKSDEAQTVAIALTLALAIALTIAGAGAFDTNPMLFIGAYIHYRRRMNK